MEHFNHIFFFSIRDLNDDTLSFILGDYVPSFRNSIGELQLPSSPAASVLAVAGSFCNDDIDGSSSKDGQVRERSLSPSKSEQPTSVQTPSTETVQDEPLTVEEVNCLSLFWLISNLFHSFLTLDLINRCS